MIISKPSRFVATLILATGCLLNLTSCRGSSSSSDSSTVTVSISGQVTGLEGVVALSSNGLDELRIEADGPFIFPTKFSSGTEYEVAVATQPVAQTCTVENGKGVAAEVNITAVAVKCVAATQVFTIGGTASGLDGTLVLKNNDGDDLTLTEGGAFTFASSIANGAEYAVTIAQQPAGQTCSVANGSGVLSGSNVTNVTVQCSANAYTVGGTVSGLSGSLVLQNNAGDDLAVTTNGSFTFSSSVADAAAFSVTISSQPNGQSCSIANAAGTINGAAVTNVNLTCVALFTVGGTVSGLTGTLVLRNNGADDETISANGGFIFDTSIANNSAYAVTVATQPSGQLCTVSNGSGTISANVSNVAVACINVKIIRLSATTTNGNLGANPVAAMAAADALCGAGYKALLGSSVRNTSTDWPLAASQVYVRQDGTTIIGTTDSNSLFVVNLTAGVGPNAEVWAGFEDNWTLDGNTCSDWTSTAGKGGHGYAYVVNTNWYSYNNITGAAGNCTNVVNLYCVQQ